MKRILTRRIVRNGEGLNIKFEYWPATYDTRTEPGEREEINILTINDKPFSDEDEGYNDIVLELMLIIDNENDFSDQTVVVEEWD